MAEQLKVAVIGCGGHAQGHFRMIRDQSDMRLVAIAEVDPKRLKLARDEYLPLYTFGDYKEMLEHCDLDVVYIATMPGHILPIVINCLESGLHVSVEKPPGMSVKETKQMAEVARRSKGKAIVSFNRRYIPEVLAVRRMIQEGGGAVHCSATYNKPLTRLGTAAMAGIAPDPIICDAIHHVDLLRWLAGPSEEKAANVVELYSEVSHGDRPGAHRYNALMKFDTGSFGVMMSHYGVGYRVQRADIHAEDVSAYLDLTTTPLRYELYAAKKSKRIEGSSDNGILLDLDAVGGSQFNETTHFVQCIRENRTPWSNLDDAVHTMQLCEAIRDGYKGTL